MKHARPDYNRIQDPAGLIPEDEPVFLFRAQDRFAADAIYGYLIRIEIALKEGEIAPEFVQATIDHLAQFINWPVKKTPDLPAVGPVQELDPATQYDPGVMLSGAAIDKAVERDPVPDGVTFDGRDFLDPFGVKFGDSFRGNWLDRAAEFPRAPGSVDGGESPA